MSYEGKGDRLGITPMIEEVYERLDYPQIPVRRICREFLKVIAEHMGKGEELYFDNIGFFFTKRRTVTKKFPDGKKRTRLAFKFRTHPTLYRALLENTGEVKEDVLRDATDGGSPDSSS